MKLYSSSLRYSFTYFDYPNYSRLPAMIISLIKTISLPYFSFMVFIITSSNKYLWVYFFIPASNYPKELETEQHVPIEMPVLGRILFFPKCGIQGTKFFIIILPIVPLTHPLSGQEEVTQSIHLSAFCQRKNMISYILLWKLNPLMAFKPNPVSSNISCHSFCLLPDDNKLDLGAAGKEVTLKFRMQDF